MLKICVDDVPVSAMLIIELFVLLSTFIIFAKIMISHISLSFCQAI